jgi:hypothetical protein
MPHERIFGSRPSLEGFPVFDQTVVVRTPEPIRRKHYRFNGRGNIGGFVGFSDEIRGYRVYVPSHGKPIKETTDVVILDSMLVDEVVLEDDQEPLNQGEDVDDDAAPSINERNSAPVYTQDAERILHDTSWSPEEVEAANGVSELTRRRRSERVSARNIGPAFLCLAAIRTEIKALEANPTFVLVGPPPGAHILENTIQFRIKTGPTGEILQFKARVCARGDKQIFLLDYIDTRAPVADLISVLVFLVLVVKVKLFVR